MSPFVGQWTYRSLLNDANLATEFGQLEFGRATLVIDEVRSEDLLHGSIGGNGWSLTLHGSMSHGAPMQARFQGKGLVGGEQWVYDYLGYLVPIWPNSDARLQRPAIVGSVVRTVAHSSSAGGTAPAGVVASFYAVRVD